MQARDSLLPDRETLKPFHSTCRLKDVDLLKTMRRAAGLLPPPQAASISWLMGLARIHIPYPNLPGMPLNWHVGEISSLFDIDQEEKQLSQISREDAIS
jgi:hypothetical protein